MTNGKIERFIQALGPKSINIWWEFSNFENHDDVGCDHHTAHVQGSVAEVQRANGESVTLHLGHNIWWDESSPTTGTSEFPTAYDPITLSVTNAPECPGAPRRYPATITLRVESESGDNDVWVKFIGLMELPKSSGPRTCLG